MEDYIEILNKKTTVNGSQLPQPIEVGACKSSS